MEYKFKFLLLFCLKAENFIRLDRNELEEEIKVASKTSEVHKFSEKRVPEPFAILYYEML